MPQATMAQCPQCGAKVRKEKLRRHMSGVHGGAPKPPKEPVAVAAGPTVHFPWKMLGVLAVAAGIILAGYWFATRPPTGGGNTSTSKVVVMETNYGTIKIELNMGRAPRTAGNFLSLVTSGKYDSNSFHRVAANFVIQGGAVSGAANVAWENTGLKNVRYSIAMARSGSANDTQSRDSATSQFFINLKDNPNLDSYDPTTGLGFTYAYVVFGLVIEGQSVVDAIGSLYPGGQPNYDGPPTSPVTIVRAYLQT